MNNMSKGVKTAVLIIVLVASLMCMCTAVVITGCSAVPTESGIIDTDTGQDIAPDKVHELMNMTMTSTSSDGIPFKAIVSPANATNPELEWSLRWTDSAAEWAIDKEPDSYVKLVVDQADNTIAKISSLLAFGEQLILTVVSIDNIDAKAEVTIDYRSATSSIVSLYAVPTECLNADTTCKGLHSNDTYDFVKNGYVIEGSDSVVGLYKLSANELFGEMMVCWSREINIVPEVVYSTGTIQSLDHISFDVKVKVLDSTKSIVLNNGRKYTTLGDEYLIELVDYTKKITYSTKDKSFNIADYMLTFVNSMPLPVGATRFDLLRLLYDDSMNIANGFNEKLFELEFVTEQYTQTFQFGIDLDHLDYYYGAHGTLFDTVV